MKFEDSSEIKFNAMKIEDSSENKLSKYLTITTWPTSYFKYNKFIEICEIILCRTFFPKSLSFAHIRV